MTAADDATADALIEAIAELPQPGAVERLVGALAALPPVA